MRAKVNPKPAARNGRGRPGNTDKASVSTARVEAIKNRSRERCPSVSHVAILCRAARTRYVRSLLKRSRRVRVSRTDQRAFNAEASAGTEVVVSPKLTTPTHLPTHNTRIKPTREAGSAWTNCYARQGKPEAGSPQRVGQSGRHGQSIRRHGAGRGQQGPKPTAPPIRRS